VSDERARGFLQHIVAEPDDDAPRLIYADWLEEHGDAARAELIRTQIERMSLPKWDARRVRLGLRERALLAQHGQKWKAELPHITGVEWGEFRRGFVTTATFASFEALREKAGASWAAAPIEAVSVRWPRERESCQTIAPIAELRELSITGNLVDPPAVERLADAPLLSTLRILSISNASLMAEGFYRLALSPHLKCLRALRLPGNAIGNQGIRALDDATSLTSLEELDLSETDSYGRYGEDPIIDATGLEALVGSPCTSRLRSLTLSGNSVGQRGLRALLRSPRAAGLKELVLRDNGLLGQAMEEFETARPELQLDALDLGGNPMGDLGAAHLAKASCLRELKVLKFDVCEMLLAGAWSLARAPFLTSLRRLNLGYNSIRFEGLQALLDAEPQHLHTLVIYCTHIDNDGVSYLAQSPASDTLLIVNLLQNAVTGQAARALAASPHLRNLLVLRMNGNRIDNRAASALRDSSLGKRLAVMELTSRDGHDDEIPF
jgi:uncharacterized protein (TIGR02996 family)